jgi:hypothetical protein
MILLIYADADTTYAAAKRAAKRCRRKSVASDVARLPLMLSARSAAPCRRHATSISRHDDIVRVFVLLLPLDSFSLRRTLILHGHYAYAIDISDAPLPLTLIDIAATPTFH